MVTYIRNNIKGYYIEFDEELDANVWAGKFGTTYNDFLNGKWVLLSNEQVAFHNEHPYASVREVISMRLNPQPDKTLEQAKAEKIAEIEQYDSSDNVNIFYAVKDGNTISDWFTPDIRSDFYSSIIAAENKGEATLQLYLGEIPVTLPTEIAKGMLSDIQLYANACANVTKAHKIAVEALESVEDVTAYDNTLGYPERLVFNLDAQGEQEAV